MGEIPFPPAVGAVQRRWRLRRNCCVSPRQFIAGTGAIVAVATAVGLAGAWHGIWLIPLYCLAEVIGTAAAAFCFIRHARDGEDVALLRNGTLVVDLHEGQRVTRHVLHGQWVRIVRRGTCAADLSVWLHEGRLRVRLARHLDPARLLAFEADIRQALAQRPSWSAGPLADAETVP